MKPFKKRKIYTEPTKCPEEKLATVVYDSKALLFPYDDNQASGNVSKLVKTLTKGIDDQQPLLWKKVTLLTFYVRKSLKIQTFELLRSLTFDLFQHRRDLCLNTCLVTDLMQNYFECLLKSSTNSDVTNFMTIVSLFFHENPENVFNFILACNTVMKSEDTQFRSQLLLKLASSVPLRHVDELPSYTRVILVFQKILQLIHDTKLHATLEDTLLQHLPEQIPFACDDQFKQLLTDICPDSTLTRDILRSPYREENSTKLMEIQR